MILFLFHFSQAAHKVPEGRAAAMLENINLAGFHGVPQKISNADIHKPLQLYLWSFMVQVQSRRYIRWQLMSGEGQTTRARKGLWCIVALAAICFLCGREQ